MRKRKTHTPDVVYIVESSLDSNFFEGKALHTELISRGNNCEYFLFNSEEDLKNILMNDIPCDFEERRGKFSAMPFIHISGHGSNRGIHVPNNEFISWLSIIKFLRATKEWFGPVLPADKIYLSRIGLVLSTCYGSEIKKHLATGNDPYQFCIYMKQELDGRSLLDSFAHFYDRAAASASIYDLIYQINNSIDSEFIVDVSSELDLYLQEHKNLLNPKD